jgi:hypothetical protein
MTATAVIALFVFFICIAAWPSCGPMALPTNRRPRPPSGASSGLATW